MSITAKTTDCGCGCGGSGSSDCGCGGHGGAATCTDMSFQRPRFFAGQLLTEDDLQAMTDYVVGKNRLHNRFLFGDGVVCGLSVTCHPCGEGEVIVAPGYALDCCGNDILLPCKEELDIKALLRDLRKRRLAGYDCGDPCDDKDDDTRTYGLYLTYTETMEDPVAPYTSGDPCGQQACEPTRICEGYKFELRCDCNQSDRLDLFKRIAACIGDLRQATAAVAKAQTADFQSSQLQQASLAIESEAPIAFDANSIRILEEETPRLAELNEISLENDLDEKGAPKLKPEEKALRLDLARLQLVTGAVTRFRALPSKEQEETLSNTVGLAQLLSDAETTVAAAGPRFEILAPLVLKTPLARIEAAETVRLSRKFVIEDAPEGRFETVEAKMVALNVPASFRQVNQIKSDASLLKDWLLDKLANSASLTRCDLYDRLRRIRVDAIPGQEAEGDLAEIKATAQGVRQLVVILVEYLIDCICLALNPPCQPCDDPSVLLACVKIKDCDVVDICNMSRRFVLSPVAMRYWLPPIGIIGDLMKKLCCDFDIGKLLNKRQSDLVNRPPDQVVQSFLTATPKDLAISQTFAPQVNVASINDDAALVLKNFNIAPKELETISAFSSNLALLSVRAAAIDPVGLADRGTSIAKALGGQLGGQAPSVNLGTAAGQAEVAELVSGEVAVLREDVKRDLSASFGQSISSSVRELRAEMAEDLTKTLGANLDKQVTENVSSAVTRELTEAKLRRAIQGTTAVKTLKEQNIKLTRDLKRLTAVVEKLQGGGDA